MGSTLAGLSADADLFRKVAQGKNVSKETLRTAEKTGTQYIKIIIRAFIILCFIVVSFGVIASGYLISANPSTVNSKVWKDGALGLGAFTMILYLLLMSCSIYVFVVVEKDINQFSEVLSKVSVSGAQIYKVVNHTQLSPQQTGAAPVANIIRDLPTGRKVSVDNQGFVNPNPSNASVPVDIFA